MLGRIFACFCLLSTAFALATGRILALGTAVLSGADRAVTVTLGLLGSMCLWCGILNVWKEAGVTKRIAKVLSPLLSRLFPTAWHTGNGKEEIALAVAANLLGVGNAATALSLRAMEQLQRDNPHPDRASDDQVTFTVYAAAPLSLLPTTLIALRAAAGSQQPTEILPAVWLCSLGCTLLGMLLARGLRRLWRR